VIADNHVNTNAVSLANSWNSTTERDYWLNGIKRTNHTGNYWGDYTGIDVDGDGIGDTPYTIDANNVDYYPMVVTRPATSFDIHLKQGWNLVSSPLVVDPPVNTSAFRGTNVTMVARYNRGTGGFDIYRVGKTPVPFPVEADCGYFLYCNNDTSYTINGYGEEGRSTIIYQGWNMIGWTNLTSSNARLVTGSLNNATMLARYNTTNGNYDIYRTGKTPTPFSIVAGEGYFLYTTYADPQTLVMG
jgi:hypothetical protein